MIALWVISGIVLLILIFTGFLLFAKTSVYISYTDEKLSIKFRNGILRYTLNPNPKKEKKPREVNRENIAKEVDKKKKRLTDNKTFLWTLLREMRFRVKVVKTKIQVDFGTGDPADTGILYGIIWAAVGNIYQVFNQYIIFDFPETEINPDFENKIFKTRFEGIIRVRLVHIITALAKSIKKK